MLMISCSNSKILCKNVAILSVTELHVKQLAYRTTPDALRHAFAQFGQVLDVRIPQDNGRSRGFGFVVMRDEDAASLAVRQMNGNTLDGSTIGVSFADRRRDDRVSGKTDDRHGYRPDDARRSRARSRSPPKSQPRSRSPQTHHRKDTEYSRTAPPSRPPPPPSHAGNERSSFQAGNRGRFNPVDEAMESKIYVSGLPLHTTEEMLVEYFGMCGAIARKREKHKFKDQWPFNVKLYLDDNNKFRGDALVTYEDPNAAKSAPGFFDGTDFHGSIISVQAAKKT